MKDMKLTILHTNDTHGKLRSERRYGSVDIGGASFRSTLINEKRNINSETPNHYTILIDLGDILEGDPISHFFKGEPDIVAMNHMGYDMAVIGNHDFGFSIDSFEKMAELAEFPFLSCNLKYSHNQKYIGLPYIIKKIGGISIGFIGVTSSTVKLNTFNGDQDKIIFEDPLEKVEKYMGRLRNEGVDSIIILSHLGIEEDRELAQKIDGVDFIIGSHSHTWMERAEYINGIPIVQAGAYSKSMGRSDITFKDGKFSSLNYRLIDIGDNSLGKKLFKYYEELNRYMNHVVGTLDREYNTDEKNRKPASLNQLMLQLTLDITGADVAMATSVSVLGKIGPGEVTRREIYDSLPFDNYVTTLKVTGRQLKEILKSRREHLGTNFYTQVRGIRFTDENETDGFIGGKRIEDEKLYTIVTDNYLASGGGKDGILDKIDKKMVTNIISRDLLIEFIENSFISQKTLS